MLQSIVMEKIEGFFSQYRVMQYKPRTVISAVSDLQPSVFYIKNGFLRVFRLSEQGAELTVTILKPKDFFPFTYGMTASARNATYYLESITSLEMWKVHSDQFVEFVKSEPDVYYDLTEKLLIRFDGVLTKMEYLILKNAYTKIVATLLSCANKFGEAQNDYIRITVPLTHKDIATMVGITRETTSLEMKKLEKQGFIARNGKYLILKNIQQLEQEALPEITNNSSNPYFL